MKTIICPNYLKSDLINNLLEKNNTSYITDTKIIPLSAFIDYKNNISDELLLLKSFKKLLHIKENLNIYNDMLKYPAFIKEIVDFTKQLITYDLNVNTLPEKTLQQIELKKIIETIIDLPFNERFYSKYKVNSNLTDILVVDYFTTNTFEYNIKNQLLENGAKLINLLKVEYSNKSVRFSLNKREEIESIAQDICKKENALDSTIICCDPENQIRLINQIFSRYNIPIQNIKYKVKPRIISDFILLANLSVTKEYETMIKYITSLDISIETLDYIDRYINSFVDLLKFKAEHIDNNLVSSEIEDLILELKPLLEEINYNDILINTYNILKNKYIKNNSCDIRILKKIKTIIEDCYKEINTKEDFKLILYAIEELEMDIEENQSEGVIITSLNKPIFSRKHSYVLGCTYKVYPGFTGLKGIFDEKYVSSIDYPTIEERHKNYFKQFKWIESSAKEIIYSYHISNLEGKGIEGSFELEKYGKPNKWVLLSIDKISYPIHSIDKATSNKLFFKEETLYGSVSSFEKFSSCPYKYFINYGLKIKEKRDELIDNITVGNLMHSLMENLLSKHKKNYTKVNDSEIDEILNELKDKLLVSHPKNKQIIDILFSNIKSNLKTNLSFLNEMEKDTSFNPEYFEYRFNNYPINNGEIILNGSIDRIDIAYDLLRIIDYKTGSVNLKLDDLENGTSLQLISYLIIACTLLDKNPMGAYYYSFKAKTFSVDSNINSDDLNKQFIKNSRLLGVYFNEDTTSLTSENDKFYRHIKSKGSNIFLDYESLIDGFNKIYKSIYTNLQEGIIDTIPTDNACTYCGYKTICRYKGKQIDLDSIFNFAKGDNNEME